MQRRGNPVQEVFPPGTDFVINHLGDVTPTPMSFGEEWYYRKRREFLSAGLFVTVGFTLFLLIVQGPGKSYTRNPLEVFEMPLQNRQCDANSAAPNPGFMALCKPGWSRNRIKSIGEDLIIYEAVIHPPTRARATESRLRVTALVTDPISPVFYFGNDHMGVSSSAERIAKSLSCKSNGVENDATVRYVGHDEPGVLDRSPEHVVRVSPPPIAAPFGAM